MDHSEKQAQEYLISLGFKSIIYEPDGNVPPDFLADNRVAVEVRRLNQYCKANSGLQALEKVAFPLAARLENLLASLGPPRNGTTWFVCYTFERPVPPWRFLARQVYSYLCKLRDDHPRIRENVRGRIANCLEIELIKASRLHDQCFILGAISDGDAGGLVFEETRRSLVFCIREKTSKIAHLRHKYPEWWLILLDHVGYGVEARDREFFRKHMHLEHTWDKVVLLSPLSPQNAFEVPAAARDELI